MISIMQAPKATARRGIPSIQRASAPGRLKRHKTGGAFGGSFKELVLGAHLTAIGEPTQANGSLTE